jgi:general secretion pathway protein A
MFEQFYQFREKPFQLAPNPDFLYESEKHQHALTYMEYGLTENVGIIVLTGEVGSGKTTTAQYILRQLGDGFDTAMIANTNVSAGQMLRMVQAEFELDAGAADKAKVIESSNRHLIGQYEADRRTLLVIDEAQNLSPQALEEVRMLSNLQSDQYALLQILLIGQPELLRTLKKPEMRQFSQRVAVHFHLTALDRTETAAYIAHRIRTAGGPEGLFTDAAIQMIYELSEGVPRSINLICQAALVYGFADEAPRITQDIVRQITRDRIGVGIQAEPAAVASDEDDDPVPSAEALENIRMEVKGRVGQLEAELAAHHDRLMKQLEALLDEERRKNDRLEQKVVDLEKRLATLSRLFEQLARRQNHPSVVRTMKKTPAVQKEHA